MSVMVVPKKLKSLTLSMGWSFIFSLNSMFETLRCGK